MPSSIDRRKTAAGRLARRGLFLATCLLVVGFYAWTARPQARQMYGITNPAEAYYNQLVDSFRRGQLNLQREVPPGLAALADPYDPVANQPYRFGNRLHDLSYYKGKFYLYFGVTPVLILFWPYAVLTGHYLFHKQAAALFCAIGFLAGAALLRDLRRRYFPGIGEAVMAAGALALGSLTTVPLMLQRADVWEVAISCAYAMVLLALACLWRAWHAPARSPAWVAAASLAYGLAVGARPSLLFGSVILLVPAGRAWQKPAEAGERRWPLIASLTAAAVVPLLLIGAGLMLYNTLRFDSPLEFGQHYQLSGQTETEMQQLFSWRYVEFNLRVYFLQPLSWGGAFPFVADPALPAAPAGYLGVDDRLGVLPNIPFVWLALAAPLLWWKRGPAERSILRAFAGALILLAGASLLITCFFGGASLRYEVDFVPALVLLALCGVLGLERAAGENARWRIAVRGGWTALLLVSVAINFLECCRHYADERFRDGLGQRQLGHLQEAEACFESALRVAKFPAAYDSLGTTLLALGHDEQAIRQFESALRLDPGYYQAHYGIGIVMTRRGRMDEATREFRRALALKPDCIEAEYALAVALEDEGHVAEAIPCYEAVLREDPRYPGAREGLARTAQAPTPSPASPR
ncbi:MAG TPA: tetratricopeptide repeat protein [Opitutaceae bacterium]|nr:tetratricopeptide repeat protein [Opitutaceae bacterium]